MCGAREGAARRERKPAGKHLLLMPKTGCGGKMLREDLLLLLAMMMIASFQVFDRAPRKVKFLRGEGDAVE